MNANDPLLQPFQIKNLTIKNRVFSTSHAPSYADDGMPKERYQLYHEEKAKGGIGMTMFGGSSTIDIDSPASFGQLDVSHDRVIPYFQQLADRVHKHGAATMCQITHMGRRTSSYAGDWLPTVAPSAVREPAHRSFPKQMEQFDIDRIVKAFGDAARRCKEGGLDGVELSAQATHLLDAFWTPKVNRRNDHYGGSLDNRMRLSTEVLEEVRRQVGDGYIVGMRLSTDQMMRGGMDYEECLEILKKVAGTGLVDFLNVSVGHAETDEGLSHLIPNMGSPSAPYLAVLAQVKKEIDIPIFHAARIADVATARHAIESGAMDLVGMTRAHIADPHIMLKVINQKEDQIRPCVGAGYCIDRIYHEGEALCIHNPVTGREQVLPHDIPKIKGEPKKIVIIGAGVAGLEAARVCAERGHKVVLFEAQTEPGGQLRLASKVERRTDLISIAGWRQTEIERLGVECRYGVYAQAAGVTAENPDVVIVATGGEPNYAFLEAGADLVTSSWDILSGQAQSAENVLFFDDNGRHPGLSCAEHMAQHGSKLELVTPERMVAVDIGGTNFPQYLRAFYKHDVTITPDHWLTAVRKENGKLIASLFNEYSKRTIERIVDQVVIDHGTVPIDDLYFDLVADSSNGGQIDIQEYTKIRPQTLKSNPAGSYQLFRIGDAVSSRNIHAAVYDAFRLCIVL
ncbi:MAG: FAD-dependent oxidoreductase [Anaerolineae bacterium]